MFSLIQVILIHKGLLSQLENGLSVKGFLSSSPKSLQFAWTVQLTLHETFMDAIFYFLPFNLQAIKKNSSNLPRFLSQRYCCFISIFFPSISTQ